MFYCDGKTEQVRKKSPEALFISRVPPFPLYSFLTSSGPVTRKSISPPPCLTSQFMSRILRSEEAELQARIRRCSLFGQRLQHVHLIYVMLLLKARMSHLVECLLPEGEKVRKGIKDVQSGKGGKSPMTTLFWSIHKPERLSAPILIYL